MKTWWKFLSLLVLVLITGIAVVGSRHYAPRSFYTGFRDDVEVSRIMAEMKAAYGHLPAVGADRVVAYCDQMGVMKVAASYIVCNYTTAWPRADGKREGDLIGVVRVYAREEEASAAFDLWKYERQHPWTQDVSVGVFTYIADESRRVQHPLECDYIYF
ncbi:MAG: hypothetical protein P4L67_04005 [Candidatus Pacebacteria bacterium]|nr:hypothetical protein [Candidatus Paceibacterota bacterium]